MRTISAAALRRAFLYSVSTSTVLVASLGVAHAQAEGAASGGHADIVVTAQFREQRLQDTPLAITAMDAGLLESRNQTDLSQVAAQAPNVTLTTMSGSFGSSMAASIRGVGQYDFNPAYEPGVGMYIDDVYYATLTGGIFDLLDLDRVEVLRGPQGTLTGRNSIGGAIKLFSKKPSNENSGWFEAAYGSRNRIDLRGAANFVLAEDLYGRISGVYKSQKGYVDQVDYGCANPGNAQGISRLPNTSANCVIDKLGERNYAGVKASVRYNPSDNFDITITGDYTKEDRTNAADVLTYARPDMQQYICGRFCTYANFYAPAAGQLNQAYTMPNRLKFEGWGVAGNMTIGLSDSLNIQSITAYRQYRQKWGTDDDFTPDLVEIGQGFNDLKFWFVSQELRLNGKIGDNVDFTVGGFYSDQRSTYYTMQDVRYIAPGYNLQFMGNDPVNADSKAVFGTVFVRPVENLTLTGGIRYTEESKDYTFVRKNLDGTVSSFLGQLDGLTANYKGNRVDWRLSADYRFSPEVLAYVTVSTGFKGGGVSARPFNAAQAINGAFEPETLTAYEIGLKTDLLDRKLRLNLSGFINDYKDIQLPLADCSAVTPPSSDPCAVMKNAGDGQIRGVELEVNAYPVEGLDIDASVSFLDGEWKKISPAVGGNYTLNDPIVTPKWKWSVGIQYRADMGESGSITPRFDLAYTGKRRADRVINPPVLDYYDSYILGNARLTWRNANEDLSVSLEVQNIFDKYYEGYRFTSVYALSGTGYSSIGRPREWAVSVKKQF
ncbi:MAG: TonB-dependent receptor [Sphingobium sp.]|nr:TonB-dependent receptor [Sphingobium sp.]